MRDDFCVFILTHGRPDNVITARTLERNGYTGKVYLVIDDEDETGDAYRARYGDQVLTFSKDEVARYTDQFDNFTDRRAVIWARNACWDLAKQVGCKYFVQLDDDYFAFSYRRMGRRDGNPEASYHGWKIRNLDSSFDAMVKFLETTPAKTIAMSQGGDHFGGAQGNTDIRLTRKAMNSFVCSVDRPILFLGRINEDVNTYVGRGRQGDLFFTYMPLQLQQLASQSNEGGMTEAYLDSGTYLKSFYSVMTAPSCVTIRMIMGGSSATATAHQRLHHSVSWNNATPKIVSEEWKKVAR